MLLPRFFGCSRSSVVSVVHYCFHPAAPFGHIGPTGVPLRAFVALLRAHRKAMEGGASSPGPFFHSRAILLVGGLSSGAAHVYASQYGHWSYRIRDTPLSNLIEQVS